MEKMLGCIVGLWLLCGVVSAFLVVDERPMHPSDFAMGPFSLADNW